MHYQDPICGPAEITEPVLLDLLETRAVRRLDDIPQHGTSGLLRPLSALDPGFGAYRQVYLERKRGRWPIRVLGAPMEETP